MPSLQASQRDFDPPSSAAIRDLHQRHAQRLQSSDDFAAIPDLLSDRLLQRLDALAAAPQSIVDLGCTSTYRLRALCQRFPDASVYGVGLSEQMLQAACQAGTAADAASVKRLSNNHLTKTSAQSGSGQGGLAQGLSAGAKRFTRRFTQKIPRLSRPRWQLLAASPNALPFADASIDLVVASQLLPWCADPGGVFREVFRVLSLDAAFFWSAAGPDTLREYRALWQTIDSYPHVWGLRDMHDLGDQMLGCGFDAPVMDRENLTLQYSSLEKLAADLRGNALVNIAAGRRRGLMSPTVLKTLQRGAPGALDISFELLQGHGWKKPGMQAAQAGGTEVIVPLENIGRFKPG